MANKHQSGTQTVWATAFATMSSHHSHGPDLPVPPPARSNHAAKRSSASVRLIVRHRPVHPLRVITPDDRSALGSEDIRPQGGRSTRAAKLVAVGWGQLQMDHYGRGDAASSSLSKGSRYPVEIISHCVWLYHRFPLSFREVEEMRREQGMIVSYETIVRHEAPGNRVEVRDLRRRSVAAVREKLGAA
jgi:hypothetical protein